MRVPAVLNSLVVLVLCLASGAADALGFVHASRIWHADRLVWLELAKSAVGFGLGIASYWVSLRFMKSLGIVAPEIQTTVWFVSTILGVALASGNLRSWPRADQAVACLVLAGLGWLILRTGASA